MNGIAEFFKRLGPSRVAAMAAVTLGLVGFFAFIILRLSQPNMALLFSDLSLEDSAAVVKDLERQQVKYELRNDGARIFIPADLVARTRMKLAEGGMPKGGGVGYEIFDKSDALSSSSFQQNINQLRALEGELARSIRGIDRVQSARVHLVIPEKPLFSREKIEPTASIVIKVAGGLDNAQVRAIRHLVASAVKGMSPNRVAVVSENGQLLADGSGDAEGQATQGDERRLAQERMLRAEIESILGAIVGPDRVKVRVSAEMDFNRVTQTIDDFDPERKVVRSTQTREEQSQSTEPAKDGQVTVGNELPGVNGGNGGNGLSRETSKKTDETINYEIARTQRTEVFEQGRIKRLSVAVLVDGLYTRDAQGNVNYAPRAREELDRLAALVRMASGFNQARGDAVEIVNLRFAEPPRAVPAATELPWWMPFEPTKDDIRYAIELGVLLLISLLVLIFVVRPLVKRVVAPEEVKIVKTTTQRNMTGEHGAEGAGDATALPGAVPTLGQSPSLQPSLENGTLRKLEAAEALGEAHSQSIAKVGELVDKNPHETAAIIRGWLQEDGQG